MKRFRYNLFVLLVALTLLFNIERIDLLGQQNVLDIQSFVYSLGIFSIASVLFVPALWKTAVITPISIWLVIYLICKILFFYLFPYQNPLYGGAFTYISITEATFLAILILYTHRLVNNIAEYEDGVREILFSQDVKNVDSAREAINTELMRSRHYHRPMSVIVVEPKMESLQKNFNQTIQELQNKLTLRYMQNKLAKTIRQELRLMDMVLAEEENGRFVILCPEVDAKESNQLMTHIKTAVHQSLDIDVDCGTASFPDEAPTFDGLVEQATEKIQHGKKELSQEEYRVVHHIYRSQENHV